MITKDLKTLEKAVYKKSDITSSTNISNLKNSDGLKRRSFNKTSFKIK